MKYYAVKVGREVGVFEDWAICQAAVSGFPNAEYKSFNLEEEARAYLAGEDLYDQIIDKYIATGIAVAFCDGSFDERRNVYSYGVHIIDIDRSEKSISGTGSNQKYLGSRNIMGEILGAINSMDWAVSNHRDKLAIFYDFEGIGKWAKREWIAKTEVAKAYMSIYEEKYEDILEIDFNKVKGHSNNKYNEKADELAKRALTDNERIKIVGDNWYTINFIDKNELDTIMSLIKSEHETINIVKDDKANSTVYKLSLGGFRLSVTLYNSGLKKLLVQGANTIIFQIFTTYIYELTGHDGDQILSSAYRKKIDQKTINDQVKASSPIFPTDYPDNIKRLIRQSIINLNYYIESEEYSQYVFPACRALEGHMKYLFEKAGLTVKNSFTYFKIDQSTQSYILPSSVISDQVLRQRLEKYYNFYHATRHTIFHFGDIIGSTDTTRLVETKEEANDIINECLSYIRE